MDAGHGGRNRGVPATAAKGGAAPTPTRGEVSFIVPKHPLTPEQRSLRASIAAQSRWAQPGARKRQSEAISEARIRQHEKLVDPDGTLDPKERRQCAEASLKAEMTRLALKASKARTAGKGRAA